MFILARGKMWRCYLHTPDNSFWWIIKFFVLLLMSSQISAYQRSAFSNSSYGMSSYPIKLPKDLKEIFVVNFELGFFACQVNASSDFLEVYSLSRLCDGVPNCFGGIDENRQYIPCSSQCSAKCAHGVCLESTPSKPECFCDDGYTACDCNMPAINECKYRPCDIFAKCTNSLDSYYCTCFPGFTGDGKTCTDIDECVIPQTASKCVANSECCNIPGSFLCRCLPGFRGNGLEKCVDINECIEGNPCPSGSKCVNTVGSYTCSCAPGFSFNTQKQQCVDVNECLVTGCASGANCRNYDGGYECICPDKTINAYDVSGSCTRTQIIRMTTPTSVNQEGCQCGPGAICVLRGYSTQCICPPGTIGQPANPIAGCFPSYPIPCNPFLCSGNAVCQGMRCVCAMGFQGVPPNCVDVNECTESPCAANAQCFNVPGSYQCQCPNNLRARNPYDHNDACLGACELKRCGKYAVCVEHLPGNAVCQCPAGYTGIPELECQLIQCPANPELVCGRNAACQVTSGTRVCSCLRGFVGSPPDTPCIDINECVNNPCAVGAFCTNTVGSYSCECPSNTISKNAYNPQESCRACPDGSQRIGPAECADVSKCVRNPCGPNGQCVNTNNGYSCNCHPGFTSINGGCIDINECAGNPCAKGAVCINVPGSYSCECNSGEYVADAADRTATCRTFVSNPCEGFSCWSQGQCTFDEGDDACYCKDGFTGSPDKSCYSTGTVVRTTTSTITPPTPFPTDVPDKSILCLYDRCRCAPGYQGKYPNCTVVNECLENPCSPGTCTTGSSGRAVCACPKGYEAQGSQCVSVNECVGPQVPCAPGTCIPAPGSYNCICPKNFKFLKGKCVAINQCVDNPDVCSPGSCITEYGTYRCDCPSGYYFVDGICGNVDECAYNPCTPGSCKDLPGTYECNCPKGYSAANGQCVSVDQCTPNPCGQNGVCVGKPGGYQCACISGYTFDGTTCVDINECVENPLVCQPGSCVNTEGSYICRCQKGFTFRDGGCVDINECVVARPCGLGMKNCLNTIGSYNCECKPGYRFNGVTCMDIDECAATPNLCLPGTCRNTEGAYICLCPVGYEFANGACSDVNECTDQPCATNALCTNTIGSYECRCPPDMKVKDAFDDTAVCQRINLCSTITCPSDSSCVIETNRPRCVCLEGYIGTPGNCRPSKCQIINCGDHASCLPVSEGGVACLCKHGFRLIANPQNAVCVDINECVETPDVCGSGQCQNTIGSYTCKCAVGFSFDGTTCADIDECTNPETCGNVAGSLCINTIGSYECRCPAGLVKSGGICSFVKVCEQNQVCGIGQCVESPPNYRCTCPNAYEFKNGTCVAVNECILNNPCGPGATCQDMGGRYICLCPKGFGFDDLTCVDINECVRNPCGVGSRECVNTRGSYSCNCQSGYTFNGRTCEDINECLAPKNPCEPGQCINLPGSYTCVCPAKFELVNGQACAKVNHCVYNPCTVGTCIEDFSGGYSCQCPTGFEFKNGGCEDIDECSASRDVCLPGTCFNTIGSYQCRCPSGFKQLNGFCVAIRQCELPGICGVGVAGAYCRDLPGGHFECNCPLGYQSAPGSPCVEVNECVDNPCAPGTCNDQGGSYVCFCPNQFQAVNGRCISVGCERSSCSANARCLTNERQEISCECAVGFRESSPGNCVAVNECTDSGRNPCGEAGTCMPVGNSYDCFCPKGYQKVGLPPVCTAVDECSLQNPCLVGSCVNTKGTYKCICPNGYQVDSNGRCVDVNECAAPNPPCEHGYCINTEGSFQCSCPDGFKLQVGGDLQIGGSDFREHIQPSKKNRICVDVRECAIENPCKPGQCQELPGTYKCICPKGWMPKNGNCTEINECVPVNPCGRGTCRKISGNPYTCDCLPGYQFLNGRCVDINECAQPNNPCIIGKCINTEGSYSCSCPRGYFFNGRFCEDRNECIEFLGDLCPGGGTCVNTPGSYRCVCPPLFDLVDGKCVDLNTCEYITCGAQSLPCRDSDNGPVCQCPPGYYGDARILCIPAPSCESTRDCGPNADCQVQITGSLYKIVCSCRVGFQGNPPAVECEQPCPAGFEKNIAGVCAKSKETTCIQTSCAPGVCQEQTNDNTPPCLCPEGTRYLWDKGVCAIIPPQCGPPNPCAPGQCTPQGYTWSCTCPTGYRSKDDTCVDVNECVENAIICGLGGTCTNQPGTYQCQCAVGFDLRDNACYAVNKCEEPANPCDPGRCLNNPSTGNYHCECPTEFRFLPSMGICSKIITPCIQNKDLCKPGQCQAMDENNYRCSCPRGFTFDGVTCIEVNECAQNPCGRGQCKNMPGYYECVCPAGYRNVGRTCEEINECIESTPCGKGTCQNLDGAYQCLCMTGFEFDGSTCVDVNECTSRNRPDCGSGQCINTIGSYICRCTPGFRNVGTNGPCVDIQECRDTPQPCLPGSCVETSGGYQCKCPAGFQFINGGCVQINFCLIGDKCKPGTCALTDGSYICTCPAGYSSTSTPARDCVQVNECALNPPPCGEGAINCIDTLGSYQCVCGPGFKLSDNRKLCVDINECANPTNPCTPGDCINQPGSFVCLCPLGFDNSTGSSCKAVNECAASINPCLPGDCVDLIGSYQCNCPTGYQFVEGRCSDINECIVSQPCRHGVCVNTLGSYVCRCDAGFQFSDGTCININECTNLPCAQNAQCIDTEGSYNCVCPQGTQSVDAKREMCRVIPVNPCESRPCYKDGSCRGITRSRIDGTTENSCECLENFVADQQGLCKMLIRTCEKGFKSVKRGSEMLCENINECSTNSNLCMNGRCKDVEGSFTCECNVGYRLSQAANSDAMCVDINECEVSAPCGRGTCINTPGSYYCQCFDGFRVVDGTSCVEIKTCVERSPCNQGTCVDTSAGKYTCRCPPGFAFDGTTCTDINECAASQNPCVTGDCINTIGSYVCRCRPGYVFQNSRCVDINECAITNPCAPGECHNTEGSFFCVCPSGYQRKEPGICVEINECARANPCGDGKGICINTLGSFQCQCLPGFSFDQISKTCTSIDECAITTVAKLCLPGECENTAGSYFCKCPAGYENTTDLASACVDINECIRNPQLCLPGNCLNTIGSFYCTCPAGYAFNNGACVDINECLDKTICGSGTCKNTIGSYECQCPVGYTFDGKTCVDINECAISAPCGVGTCINTIGSFLCTCPPGFEPGPNVTCVDINECIREPTLCGPGTCVNTIGSYLCRCPMGYTADRGTCFALNECEAVGLCGPGTCVDLVGSYMCQCPTGFEFTSGTCVNINECISNPCSGDTICHNTLGSYTCVPPTKIVTVCVQANPCQQGTCVDIPPDKFTCKCPSGYQFDGNTCIDINECTLKSDICAPGNCINLPGTYLCVCPFGFMPANGTCADINECLQQGICGEGTCQNTVGSYVCQCLPGYESRSGTCIEINECADQSVCGPGGTCQDLKGSYTCLCPPTYSFDGRTCIAMNQCIMNPDLCKPGACENLIGSYRCNCPPGFAFANGSCVDINECLFGGICGVGVCENTIGSYLCHCPPGYRFRDSSCYDINECIETPQICGLGTCQNTPGSYRCFCPPGYAFRNGTCIEINECVENSNVCNKALCRNTPGSYVCYCPAELKIDLTRLICEKIQTCPPGTTWLEEQQRCVGPPTPPPSTKILPCLNYTCPEEDQEIQMVDEDTCRCVCKNNHTPPPCQPREKNPTTPRVPTPPVTSPPEGLPEASVNCMSDGIEVQIALQSPFVGVVYVKGYSRDDSCRKFVELAQQIVRFPIKYGTCGVSPDGNMAEFVLVVQRHPTLVTVDATAYNVRCVYKPEEVPVTIPPIRVATIQGTIANAAPPPVCRIIITNMDGSPVSNANIGQDLQLKVAVSPYNVYGGFASNCRAVAVDNSWSFQVTDSHGCATDKSIFTEWILDPSDRTLRANFSAFRFSGASLLRFQCNIRICFNRCPPVVCPNGENAYGKKKRQATDLDYSAGKGDVIEEIQVDSNGLQTFDSSASALNASNGLAAASEGATDMVCLSTASFAVTLAITLLLALVAIAISVSCWILAYRRRPDDSGSSYQRSSTGYGNGTQYSTNRGSSSIPRVTVPRRGDPVPDY